MTTNVISHTSAESTAWSIRRLGALAMLGAPMLLAEMIVFIASDHPNRNSPFVGVTGLFYLAGWICSLVALRRLGVLGSSVASRIAYAIQLLLIAAAAVFSVEELIYGSSERIPLFVLDAAWPLSHTFMLVTGGFAIGAGVWKGWRRVAPFLPGLKIPVFLLLMWLGMGNGRGPAGYIQAFYASLAFLLLGYAVFTSADSDR
jgi:hypothetical protein